MRFRLLGPIQAWSGADPLDLGPPQQRNVLAALLLEPGQLVPVPRLVETVWGNRPPSTAVKNLQVYVHRLRRALAPLPEVTVRTVGSGYLLDIDPDQIDLYQFRRLVTAARTAPDAEADTLLREALALWRGPALADASGEVLRNAAAALDEQRLTAIEARLEAQLRLGYHAECAPELGRLVSEHPLRERLRTLLMIALYRSGRQAEALAAFRAGHQILTGELGIEPGAELRETHERILRADPELAAAPALAPPRPAAPLELPHDVGGFAGRGGELAELDALLAEYGTPATASVIVTVDGLGGVGKTALAVHWAHRVRDRFPDGVLYLDLRAYHPNRPPMTSGEALGHLLHGLGVAAPDIPVDEGERTRLYRTKAAQGRRLMVLDNAHSAEQVRPLLAGTRSCLTVITSRSRLSGLVATEGAHRIGLRPLAAAQSLALLTAVLGADRLAAQAPAAARLAQLCAGLPLALRIAAANLTASPRRPISALVTELASDRLAGLRVDGEEQIAVVTALDLSYRALSKPAARLFGLLGSAPGVDFSAPAASALTGGSALESLRELTAAHLVDQYGTGRYRMHDLLRAYAAGHASRDQAVEQRAEAIQRLLDWYLAGTQVATGQLKIPRLLIPPDDGLPVAQEFTSDDAAMAWLESERANMVAAVLDAAEHDPCPTGWRLALELRGFFRLRRYVTDWVAVATAGLQIAQRLADARAQAALHHSLGHASWSLGEYTDAIDCYKRTVALSVESGWPAGEAAAASALGAVYHEMGQHDEAIASYQNALRTGALSPELEIITGGSLGLVYQSVGRLREAADAFHHAAVLAENRGWTDMLATSLGNLGHVHLDLGGLATAREFLGQALALYRQVGSRNGEANVLNGLAMLDAETGGYNEATYQAVLALRITRDIGDRRIECDAATTAGAVARRRGDLAAARESLVEAIDLAETVGYGRGLGPALAELAVVELGLGDVAAAAAHAARALTHARGSNHRPAEAQALVTSVRVSLARGEYDAAVQQGRMAVEICRELGLRLTLARGLSALDEALCALGNPAPSPYHAEATAIFAELGCTEQS